MTPATQDQIEVACMTRSGADAWRHLQLEGLTVTRDQCDATIAALIEAGRRGKLGGGGQGVADVGIDHAVAKNGCDNLLAAMVASFRRKAKRLGCTFEEAMATSNGNQAVRA